MLTKKQRQDLRAQLQPLVREIFDSPELKSTVEAEIQNHLKAGGTSTNYEDLILAGSGGRGPDSPTTRRNRELPPGARVFARLALVAGLGRGDHSTELELARSLDVEDVYKAAQSAGSAEGGGLLIEEDMSSEIIELLRPFSVIRQLPTRMVTIPRGNLRTPKITSGVQSGFVAEGQAIPAGSLTTGSINLIARKLASLIAFTSELRSFGGEVDQILVDDLLASIGTTEDKAFLFGTGTESEPLGITEAVDPANKFDATQAGAAATLTEVQTDLRKAEQLLLDADVPMRAPTWILSPRSRLFLRDLRDTEDRGVYGEEMARSRTINGIPFAQTNNIPNDLGSGDNESLVILVDASELVIGDVEAVAVDRSDSAMINIDGTDTSLFSHDMSAVRVRRWVDMILRHNVSAAVLESVKWGA